VKLAFQRQLWLIAFSQLETHLAAEVEVARASLPITRAPALEDAQNMRVQALVVPDQVPSTLHRGAGVSAVERGGLVRSALGVHYCQEQALSVERDPDIWSGKIHQLARGVAIDRDHAGGVDLRHAVPLDDGEGSRVRSHQRAE
jgi:hypothetical protein